MRPLLLLSLLLLASCANHSTVESGKPEVSKEQLDTLKIRPRLVASKPEIFETAFFEGKFAKIDTSDIEFYAVSIGNLNIESGKLIACDPIVMHHARPFVHTFPIGQFPVHLSIAKTQKDQRLAFSRIFFSDNEVAKWEFALLEGQIPIPIDSDTIYGYGVDGGIGLFIDEKSNKAFNSLNSKDQKVWSEVFNERMGENYRENWQYILYNFDGHSLASFSTGYGDGTYGTYIGYDEKGNVCRLLTDFNVVDWVRK